MTEYLDDLLSTDHFFNIAIHRAKRSLLGREIFLAASGNHTARLHHQRDHNDRHYGQIQIGVDHQKQGSNNA